MSIRLPAPRWFRVGSTTCQAGPPRLPTRHISSTPPYHHTQQPQDFEGWDEELRRRMRKVNAKRRQRGADFVDHLLVTVRGGRGGPGAAALAPSHRGTGPPSGGSGGPGGGVFIRTSPHLTSLARVSKRQIGEQGGAGAGNYKNGKRGRDCIIDVPVGTIVKELKREGVHSAWEREDAVDGVDSAEEATRRRRERWFVMHPNGEAREDEFRHAEDVLRREGYFRSAYAPSETDEPLLILDIDRPLPQLVHIAEGGRGGLGNPHFQLPHAPSCRIASRGTQPPTRTFSFELKLLADVGLVGLPNAGKSTLLRGLTGRRAEVAGYQFTTLNPQVGVVRVYDDGTWAGQGEVVHESEDERAREEKGRKEGIYMPTPREVRDRRALSAAAAEGAKDTADERVPDNATSSTSGNQSRIETARFTIADNPGLLPLASQNVGLGHSFLRSIERSLALVYVVDLGSTSTISVPSSSSSPSSEATSLTGPLADIHTLRAELEAYKPNLSTRVCAIVLNKADLVGPDTGRERVQQVKDAVGGAGIEVLVLSGKYGLGMEGLVRRLAERVGECRAAAAKEGSAGDLYSADMGSVLQ